MESAEESELESEQLPFSGNGQWTLMDIVWVTTAVAMVVAYARSMGERVVWQAVFYALAVLIIGGGLGLIARQFREALFWSGLMALLAFVAVAAGNLPTDFIMIGWGIVGSLCGALSGVRFPKHRVMGIIGCGLAAGGAMLAAVQFGGQSLTALIRFDIYCAIAIGLIIRPLVEFLMWVEQQIRHPRIVLAAWLTAAIVLGNFLVPIVGGVQR